MDRPPDVLLIDLWPGRGTDLEMARKLRLTRPEAKVVVLARGPIDESVPADTVVSVPFSPSRLFELISALIQGGRTETSGEG